MSTISFFLALYTALTFQDSQAALVLSSLDKTSISCVSYLPEHLIISCTDGIIRIDAVDFPELGFTRIISRDATWRCPVGQYLCINPRQYFGFYPGYEANDLPEFRMMVH